MLSAPPVAGEHRMRIRLDDARRAAGKPHAAEQRRNAQLRECNAPSADRRPCASGSATGVLPSGRQERSGPTGFLDRASSWRQRQLIPVEEHEREYERARTAGQPAWVAARGWHERFDPIKLANERDQFRSSCERPYGQPKIVVAHRFLPSYPFSAILRIGGAVAVAISDP